MLYGNHKDNRPEYTVRKIREIISGLDIFLYEESWSNFGSRNYSVRLEDAAMPMVGCNGKGVSLQFALASAYGEFIERLQNGFLYSRHFGLMPHTFRFPDEMEMGGADYNEKFPGIIEPLIGLEGLEKLIHNGEGVSCVPFYQVYNARSVYLPIDILFSSCGSNGMCAGNTPEEAITQGICEILERNAIKSVYLEKKPIPYIPLSSLAHLESYRLIEDIIENGYHIIVKDLTFGGKLPVLGVILFNRERTRYRACFASDVLLETTVQRCLTEVMQGKSRYNFEDSMPLLNFHKDDFPPTDYSTSGKQERYELNRFLFNGRGQLPTIMLNNTIESETFKSAFLDSVSDNRDALQFIVDKVREMNWALYVRDVSYLGFPAFYTYIPGVSNVRNIMPIPGGQVYYKKWIFQNLSGLLRLKSLTEEQLKNLAYYLENLFDNPDLLNLKSSSTGPLSGILTVPDNEFYNLSFKIVLMLIFYKLKNWGKALSYLNEYLAENPDVENIPYFKGVQYYLKQTSLGNNSQIISHSLSQLLGSDLSEEICSDLSNPDEAFKHYDTPDCGDCSKCSLKNDCRYPEWKTLMERLQAKALQCFPDQTELQSLF